MSKEKYDSNLEDILNQTRHQLTKNLSTGIWISKYNRVKLTKIKGKFIHTMGYSSSNDNTNDDEDDESSKQKSTYLYPEEALFLIENTSLIVYFEMDDIHIPMSIQQCYESFFRPDIQTESCPSDINSEKINLDDYKVYSHLVRLGYILRRVSNEQKPTTQQMDTSNSSASIDFSKPLINRNQYPTLKSIDIFNKLNSLIPNITLNEIKQRTLNKQLESDFKLLFNVYSPDKSFRKSNPLKEPMYQISTSSINQIQRWPNLKDFLLNDMRSDAKTQHLYSFIDNGDVLFYSFNLDLNLPILNT